MYQSGVYDRNILDEMRLTLEVLLKKILGNDKSLENNINGFLGNLKISGTSKKFRDMFRSLLEFYTIYQNEYIKHNDKVNPQEVEFVIELTTIFIKTIIKLKAK